MSLRQCTCCGIFEEDGVVFLLYGKPICHKCHVRILPIERDWDAICEQGMMRFFFNSPLLTDIDEYFDSIALYFRFKEAQGTI